MVFKKPVITIFLLIIIAIIGIWFYATFIGKRTAEPLFQTSRLQKHDIIQIVKASGRLDVKDSMRIGSVVPGVIQQMYVEENEFVKKGQLLALIDDGKENTDVKITTAALEQAKAIYFYQTQFFKRQKALYEKDQISKDAFQQAERDYIRSRELVEQRKFQVEQAELIVERKHIKAPDDGLVIGKIAREGETVTLASPATIIYTIAKDINQMEAKLEVDESVIGQLHKGVQAFMTFDTYPHRVFTGQVTAISNNPIKQEGTTSYEVTVPIDNKERLFRPGMTVDAEIKITEKYTIPAVPGNIFKISRKVIKQIAQPLGYKVQEISKKERRKLTEKGDTKTLWTFKDKVFIEKPVQLGISDEAFYEIIGGLDGSEEIVVDTIEPGGMEEFYERFFGKGMN